MLGPEKDKIRKYRVSASNGSWDIWQSALEKTYENSLRKTNPVV